MKAPNFSIHTASIILMSLIFLTMILSGAAIRDVTGSIRDQLQIEQHLRQSTQQSVALGDASDYLTSEVWNFSTSEDLTHLWNYWNEVENARRRDLVLTTLPALALTHEEQTLLEKAKAESDALLLTETRAMRLIAESIGLKTMELPPQVAALELSDEEKTLSPADKKARAAQYLFDEKYAASKQRIKEAIMKFRHLIGKRTNTELAMADQKAQTAMDMTLFYNLSVLLLLLVMAFLFYTLVTRPFRAYALSLKNLNDGHFTPLKPMGSNETKAFAQAFNKIYADWTDQKQRLEAEQFCFHVAVNNTATIVYEYDFTSDLYRGYGTLEEGKDKKEKEKERFIPHFLGTHAATLMDEKSFNRLRELLYSSEGDEIEMQMRVTHDAPLVWVRLSATPIKDPQGKLIQSIGRITNIEAEKAKEFALEEAKSRDSLTGLWNKEAGIRRVRDYMARKSPMDICGMMLLDMDDFSLFNQKEGRVFADAILLEVADILRINTGPDDILTRLGGDEFMLFIKNCPKSRATVIGPQIAAMIRAIPHGEDAKVQLSASIGMCVTEVVDEYGGLYRCAESTLNYIKAHGKGIAACYLDTSNELGTMLVDIYTERHAINAIDRPNDQTQESLVSFALELLGKSKNLNDAVFLLLSRIGRSCGLDRVSIMELDRDYLSYRFTYHWSKYPADALTSEIHYINARLLQEISNAYDEDRLCEQHILSTPSDMPSCLHAGIWNLGVYVGSMNFENKTPGYVWTPDQRKLLTEMSKVVASFILKAKADAVSQAKSDFLSRMSHEIRTPMNAITGMTAIAKTVLDDKEKTRTCLEKIESANAYLLSLINDVLDMSRIESGKVELNLEKTDLGRQMDKLEMLMRPQAEARKIQFSVQNTFSGPPVMADGLRLNQVLVNIVSNAIKFTGEDGKVAVQLAPVLPVETTDKEVRLHFSVTDTGIGISKEAMGRIFNAFEQESKSTSALYGGTGLGLTISSYLVQMMGGTLDVTSEPGKGSKFSFMLTFAYAPENREASREAEISSGISPALRGKRILLAEDNVLNREIAETILTMSGFTVESAADGKEALDMFTQSPPGFYDAILMDIRMPVMDGLEATRRIRTLGKSDSRGIPIIAMSANAFDEDMKKSLESGMTCHLSKPIEVDKVLDTLSACLTETRETKIFPEETVVSSSL